MKHLKSLLAMMINGNYKRYKGQKAYWLKCLKRGTMTTEQYKRVIANTRYFLATEFKI